MKKFVFFLFIVLTFSAAAKTTKKCLKLEDGSEMIFYCIESESSEKLKKYEKILNELIEKFKNEKNNYSGEKSELDSGSDDFGSFS